ncbi:hypothetical protein AVEN_26118-1 [Araneus ventricosus]|uniref:Uncharacterized protein n=1 Tax=Araneus ventricosus TaxID=182803 RepID=A0A4Y2NWB2_ARAVE|nr:hypothetical protein AVEN_26118-1 [Araneus ventricosus]
MSQAHSVSLMESGFRSENLSTGHCLPSWFLFSPKSGEGLQIQKQRYWKTECGENYLNHYFPLIQKEILIVKLFYDVLQRSMKNRGAYFIKNNIFIGRLPQHKHEKQTHTLPSQTLQSLTYIEFQVQSHNHNLFLC